MGTKRKEVNFTKQELDDYVNRRIFMPDLAAKHGVSKDTIACRLRELNREDVNSTIDINHAASNAKMTDEVFCNILIDYKAGMKIEDMMDKYHMTGPTINKYLRINGIPVRKRLKKEVTGRHSKPRIVSQVKLPNTIFTQIHRKFTKSMMQAYS